MENAFSIATQIAEKSPVAITGTKIGLNFARDHSVPEGLEQIVSQLCTKFIPGISVLVWLGILAHLNWFVLGHAPHTLC